jgi:hypothetical protein
MPTPFSFVSTLLPLILSLCWKRRVSWQLGRARVHFHDSESLLSKFVVANSEIGFAEVDARVGSSRKLDPAMHGIVVAAVVRFQRGSLDACPATRKIGGIRRAPRAPAQGIQFRRRKVSARRIRKDKQLVNGALDPRCIDSEDRIATTRANSPGELEFGTMCGKETPISRISNRVRAKSKSRHVSSPRDGA